MDPLPRIDMLRIALVAVCVAHDGNPRVGLLLPDDSRHRPTMKVMEDVDLAAELGWLEVDPDRTDRHGNPRTVLTLAGCDAIRELLRA